MSILGLFLEDKIFDDSFEELKEFLFEQNEKLSEQDVLNSINQKGQKSLLENILISTHLTKKQKEYVLGGKDEEEMLKVALTLLKEKAMNKHEDIFNSVGVQNMKKQIRLERLKDLAQV